MNNKYIKLVHKKDKQQGFQLHHTVILIQMHYYFLFLKSRDWWIYNIFRYLVKLEAFQNSSIFNVFLNDMLCGSLSGIGSCLSGFTLDTLKVKMQTSNSKMIVCLRQTISSDGILGLYKGVYYPLMTGPIVNAMNFGVYQLYKKVKGTNELSFNMGLEAGAFSGLVGAIIVSPVELVKCKMQTLEGMQISSTQCLKQILRTKGISGLYQGMVATIIRQIPSIAAQFAAYQYLKSFFLRRSNTTSLNIQQTAVSGGLAGTLCWAVSYPQDIIKTKVQLQTYESKSLDGGFTQCAKSIYKQQGIKGFFKGVQPCLIRAFIANAIGFYIYQNMQKICHTY